MNNQDNITVAKVSGQVPLLDRILLRLNVSASNAKPELIDHVIIEYDRSLGTAQKLAPKKFSLAGLFGMRKPVEYYRVDTYAGAVVNFEYRFRLKHPAFADVVLIIAATVSARENAEQVLVKELMIRRTAEEVLDTKFFEWVVEGIGANASSLYTDFGTFGAGMKRHLLNRAALVGLKLEAAVKYEAEGKLPGSIRCTRKEVQVQPKGYSDFIKLGFDAVLVPEDRAGSMMLAGLNYRNREQFQETLTAALQSYIRDAVSYNDVTNFLHFKVRSGLIGYWNTVLQNGNTGWKIAELVLYSDDVPPANFKFERIDVEAILRNTKTRIVSTVMLRLQDPERYRNSRITNLEAWIKEKLQQLVHTLLTNVSYAELLSDTGQLTALLKSHLDKQALQIGYCVDYLLIADLQDKTKWNFRFELGEEEQTFKTKLNEVKLNVDIEGRIRSFNHHGWKEILAPETDFLQVIRRHVITVIRQTLQRISADDFYTKFSESVEPQLEEQIRNLLINEYNIDYSVSISLRIGLSVIGEIIVELQRGVQAIEVRCFDGAARFGITFAVMAVDPLQWSRFVSRSMLSAQEIKKTIGERIRIFVENGVRAHVPDINVLSDARIPALIKKFAERSDTIVREKLGLIIDIIDVEQVENIFATANKTLNLEAAQDLNRRIKEAIHKIDIQILEAHINGDGELAVKELEDTKAKLQKMLYGAQSSMGRLSEWSGDKKIEELLGPYKDFMIFREREAGDKDDSAGGATGNENKQE